MLIPIDRTPGGTGDSASMNIGSAIPGGQIIKGDGTALYSATFTVSTNSNSGGTISYQLYAITGTPGVNAQATGSVLATSRSVALSPSQTVAINLIFDTPYTLANGTYYALVALPTDAANITLIFYTGQYPNKNVTFKQDGNWDSDQGVCEFVAYSSNVNVGPTPLFKL